MGLKRNVLMFCSDVISLLIFAISINSPTIYLDFQACNLGIQVDMYVPSLPRLCP